MSKGFYRAFEDKFRGSRELILSRLQVYRPFIEPLGQCASPLKGLDLGCGRGEWLEFLTSLNVQAHGIDLDEGMLEACHALQLDAMQGDAIAHLAEQPDASLAVISAFHLVEHLAFEQLQVLVEHAFRVLVPGGLLIMETPNPENMQVGGHTFYLDPTHRHPLPPQLLAFLPEYTGFHRTKILRLQESPELLSNPSPGLWNVLTGVSPDYAVVAQKAAIAQVLAPFDAAFNAEYGVALHTLAHRFDADLGRQSREVQSSVQQALDIATQARATAQQTSNSAAEALASTQRASDSVAEALAIVRQAKANANDALSKVDQVDSLAQQAMVAAHLAQAHIASLEASLAHHHQMALAADQHVQALLSSTSWRLTAPARFIGHLARRSLKLASRPFRAAVRPVLLTSARFVINRPTLHQRLSRLLQPFPTLSRHLHLFAINRGLLDHPSAESHAVTEDIPSERNECIPVTAFPPPTRHPLQDAAKALQDPILTGLPRPVHLDTLLNADSLAREAVQHEPVASLPKFRQDGTPLCFVLVILDGDAAGIAKSVQSCLRQTAPHWELVFLVGPEHASLIDPWLDADWRFRRCISAESDLGLRLVQALEACTAAFAGWIFEGDEADDDLVKIVSKRLTQETDIDIVYTDAVQHDGPQITAILKPDWSPFLQHGLNMLGFFAAVRKSILLGTPPWSASSWTAAYFGVLNEAARQARKVSHVREALYHCWAPNRAHVDILFDSHSAREVQRGLQNLLDRTGTGYQVGIDPRMNAPIAKPPVPPDTEVTLVILTGLSRRDVPGRGNILLVDNCVRSIVENTSFPNYRLIVVDDGDLPESLRAYLKLHGHEAISYTREGLFSFAKKSNFATSLANSGIVVLLNDDLEVIAPDWLDWMVGYAADSRVGVVGAKLLYPDNTLQHAGIVMGMNGACGHVFDHHPDDGTEYLGLASHDRNCAAVTGAAMAYRKDFFEAMGGFDEFFRVDYNDIDFCLRCVDRGYQVVFASQARLHHFHNSTFKRPHDDGKERAEFIRRWSHLIESDPFFPREMLRLVDDMSAQHSNEDVSV